MLCLYVSAVEVRELSDGFVVGNDLACLNRESTVEGRRDNVAIEHLLSDISSSSITLLSSVRTIPKGGGRRECAASSGVVTA